MVMNKLQRRNMKWIGPSVWGFEAYGIEFMYELCTFPLIYWDVLLDQIGQFNLRQEVKVHCIFQVCSMNKTLLEGILALIFIAVASHGQVVKSSME